MTNHYDEGDNYREYVRFTCQEKVGQSCSYCVSWVGPEIHRTPRPYPNHSVLPDYHYLPYRQTPTEDRFVDDWQPRVQLKEAFSLEKVSSSEPESISTKSDKYIAKPKYVLDYVRHLEVKESRRQKRMEENAREAEAAKNKTYGEYDWEGLMKEEKNLKKLRVHELDKYLIHHKLKRVLKKSKAEKLQIIQRHWHQQRLQQTQGTELQDEHDDEVEEEEEEDDEEEDYNEEVEEDEEEDEEEGEQMDGNMDSEANDESNDIVLAIIGH